MRVNSNNYLNLYRYANNLYFKYKFLGKSVCDLVVKNNALCVEGYRFETQMNFFYRYL
jgi:hypothetical protein